MEDPKSAPAGARGVHPRNIRRNIEMFGNLPRTTSRMWEMDSFDPFQLYDVCHKKCLILRVEVYNGVNITKGWLGDMLDIPDPYLILKLKGTPNRRKRTPVVDNNPNPEWNVCFQFYLDPSEKRELFVTLMDSNYVMDQELGNKIIDLTNFTPGTEENIVVDYEIGAKVNIKVSMVEDTRPNLRFSLALSDEEKYFVKRRRMHIFEAMKKFLRYKNAPKEPREVPVIAVLGSGGGFRATMSFSGVFKALDESGLLDCVMYVASLSGSSWYLSCLYSHPDFPHLLSPGDLIPELRKRMAKSWTTLLTPMNMYHYMKQVLHKSSQGQPVSFTDFFGHLVGDTLLIERKLSLLSDQRAKLARGQAPLPLYTCLNVKKDVSARVFQDWMEFSPYEIGCAKYGTFLRTEDFGSKFYVGKLIQRCKESPLHFLMGVWGSAFCILFKRLIAEGKKKEIPQMLRGESERSRSSMDDTHRGKSLDDDGEEKEEDWTNTLPVVGEDSELYSHYITNKANIKKQQKQTCKDEMMAARDIFRKGRVRVIASIKLRFFRKKCVFRVKFKPRTESGSASVLWGDMEDNCDSGSSEGEMVSSGDESSEGDETDFCIENDEMQKQTATASENATDRKKSVTFATDGSKSHNPKSRKLSKQKAMDVEDSHLETKDRKCSKGDVNYLKLANKSKLKPGDRRHSEPVMSLTQQDEASRKSSLQGANDVNNIGFSKLGIKNNANHKDMCESKNSHSKNDAVAEGNEDKGKQKTFWKDQRKSRRATQRKVQSNFWKSVLESIFQSGGLGDTRAGRAGLIYNPLRGLSLQQTFPISPLHLTTPDEDRDFQGFHEAVEVQAKKLYLVDSGLTFNIPFPLLLRPQRAVDIYLSFDFSGRPSDFHEPFKEIILAEKWARLNSVPFPPVSEMAKTFLTEPLREIYVFENPNEENCPVIIHFIIFNGQFREFKAPGVRRETEEEKEFADFKIFSDPEDTYSMFHFCYNNLQFNRISQLMEFNTQLGMKIVRKCLRNAILKKQGLLTKNLYNQKSTEYYEETLEEDSEHSDDDIFYDAYESIP